MAAESARGQYLPIRLVETLPAFPTASTPVVIRARGLRGETNQVIVGSALQFDGTAGRLDIVFDTLGVGFPVVSPWTHEEPAGYLAPARYSLVVSTYQQQQGPVDSYTLQFEVFESLPSGDFDGDGDVDGADFLQYQRDDGSSADLAGWRQSYGSAANDAVSLASVPEPSSLVAVGLLLGMLGLARGRPS